MAYKLTKKQQSDYQQAFDLLDKNKDGIISTSELHDALKAVGLNPSEDELAKMISANESEVGFKDFVGLAIRITNKSKMEEIRAYFKEFDSDNDGTITVTEARRYFEKEGLPKEEIEMYVTKMFGSMDMNRDGTISIEEFLLDHLFAPY